MCGGPNAKNRPTPRSCSSGSARRYAELRCHAPPPRTQLLRVSERTVLHDATVLRDATVLCAALRPCAAAVPHKHILHAESVLRATSLLHEYVLFAKPVRRSARYELLRGKAERRNRSLTEPLWLAFGRRSANHRHVMGTVDGSPRRRNIDNIGA